MSLARRKFLQSTALGAISLGALGRVEYLQAEEEKQSDSPAENLGFAIVGVGGRGGDHISAFSGRKDTTVLYICDVDENIGQSRCDGVEKNTGKRPKWVKDFRTALEDPAVQCVSTATPNHWHALVSIWSMQAGKHVYTEKPVSHNVWEGRQAVNAARSLNKMCQCGTQSRSSPSLTEAVKFVREGKLGKIQYVIGTCYKPRKSIGKLDKPLEIPAHIDYDLWCGPAEKKELFRSKLHYDWHWDFNTGNGDMGNQGIHQMDIARWFLGEMTLSPRVMSIGGRLGYEDAGNTPNTQVVYHDYAAAPLIFETRGLPKGGLNWDLGMDEYRGSRVGVIVQCENGYVVVPGYTEVAAFDNDNMQIQKWSGGGDHFGNFVKAVRSGQHTDLNADILDGHLSSGLCHTGAISHQVGKPASGPEIADQIKDNARLLDSFTRMAAHLASNGVSVESPNMSFGPWLEMDTATEQFTNNEAASALLTRPYREGFVVPEIKVS